MAPQHSDETERPEATEDIRARMRRGLVDAMKARDQQAVAALRSTLARIDNAEALDAEPALYSGEGHPAVAGSVLGVGAADVLVRVGRPDQAERLRAQAKLLTGYLTPPGSPPEPPHGG